MTTEAQGNQAQRTCNGRRNEGGCALSGYRSRTVPSAPEVPPRPCMEVLPGSRVMRVLLDRLFVDVVPARRVMHVYPARQVMEMSTGLRVTVA